MRLYELGKKRLLKKCEIKKISSQVNKIAVNGLRIIVSTVSESIFVLRKPVNIGHKPNENQFYLFADDFELRWVTTFCTLDYDTLCGADKFENFYVLRLPQGCDEENDEDPLGTKYKWELGYLSGAAYKFENMANFHKGELITTMSKTSMDPNSKYSFIIYGTSMGSIGVFIPLETREQVDFFVHMEMYMRIEFESLSGRDHQAFRSSFYPVKCVVDGDLCEEYARLEQSRQKSISSELDKAQTELLKKLDEIRNKII